MIRNICTTLILLLSFDVFAHSDMKIELSIDGTLSRLPDSYSPASFNVYTWTLSIKGEEYSFPKCVVRNLPIVNIGDIFITGSWYHGEDSRLPHYINIGYKPKNISFLFAMDTVKPISLYTVEYLTEDEICALFD